MILGAIGGDDYDTGPYIVVFHVGVTSTTFNVTIINDNILELDENFNLTMSPSTASNVILGQNYQTRINIMNDDSKYIVEYCVNYVRTYTHAFVLICRSQHQFLLSLL